MGDRAEALADYVEELRDRIAQAERERDCYRAVLEGAEYPNLDELSKQGVNFCFTVGATSAQITKRIQKDSDEARGLLRELSEEYFDGMADADQPHGAESPIPNEEMEWQMRIDAHLRDTGD